MSLRFSQWLEGSWELDTIDAIRSPLLSRCKLRKVGRITVLPVVTRTLREKLRTAVRWWKFCLVDFRDMPNITQHLACP